VNSTPHSRADHYSYSLYADPAMAESFDALRFSGPIGRLVADDQAAVLVRYLSPLEGCAVLDVGTGTGRAAIALGMQGAVVTGVDASDEMLAVARRRAEAARAVVSFEQGDAHALGFPDRAFDAAIALRVLMHTPDWRRALGELCRVARHRVVFDYPAMTSAAALQSAARRVGAALGLRVEAYRVLSDRGVSAALAANGFRPVEFHRQFVLPIALHKRINSVAATRRMESVLAAVGLRAMLGSPVTVLAERCGS
jgi:SAM-dependent methyltransferase